MNLASTAPYVEIPKIFTDADSGFDFGFFDGDVSTPHVFANDDVFALTLLSNSSYIGKIELSSAGDAPALSLVNSNIARFRIAASAMEDWKRATYFYELRKIGADDSVELLAIGKVIVEEGLSLEDTVAAKSGVVLPSGAGYGSANIIYQNASAQIVYSAAVVGFETLVPKFRSHPDVTASRTLDAAYQYWPIDASSNDVLLILPAGADAAECCFDIQRVDASSHTVTIQSADDEDIDIAGNGTVGSFTLDGQFDVASVKNILGGPKWRVI